MLIWLIIFCEVGFWIFLFGGLFVRYIIKLPKLGSSLLLCVPLLDVILLVATAYDLRSGTTAEFAHGLAAAYLGFTLVFGHGVVKWADNYFAYKYNGQDKPHEKYGWTYTKYEWGQWFKGILACGIASVILYLAIIFVNNETKTEALTDWMYILPSLMFFWFLFGPLWYTIFQKTKPKIASE
ncbi:MAG: hypothetical protein ACI8WB_004226 [Phenylobacterium sp.]|jgi:hypothetical protein